MFVGTDWEITSDGLNVTLSRKRKRKKKDTGEVYEDWEVAGYFATVENALKELVRQKVRDTELKEVKTVLAEISKTYKMIEQALKLSHSPNTP